MTRILYSAIFILLGFGLYAQSDNCVTATPITVPGSGNICGNYTTSGGTPDNMSTTCQANTSTNYVWFQYTATGSQNTITVTPGTLQNANVIYDATGCGDGAIDYCLNGTGSNPVNIVQSNPVGTTVIIGVASGNGVNGTFQLCINSVTPTNTAAGDECATAIPYCNAASNLNISNTGIYTGSGSKPSCFIGPGSNPQMDMFITFTTYTTGTIAWTGNPSSNITEYDWALYNTTAGCLGTQIACNYNFALETGANFGMTAAGTGEYSPTINAVAGNTYVIRINNWSGDGTGFVFSWQGTAQIAPTASFTINPSGVVCGSSTTVTINNTSTAAGNWTYGDGFTATNTTTPPSHTYNTPGTYPITLTIPGACPATATQYVQLYAPVAGTAAPVNTTCPSTCNGSASVTSTSGGNGIYTYSWNTGATTPSISGLCTGTYSVTITSAVCPGSVTIPVTVAAANTPGNPSFTFANYCQGAANGPVITGTAGGTFAFNPVPGGGVTINSTTGVITGGVGGSTYTVQYTTPGPCPATSTQNVTVNPIHTITAGSNQTLCQNAAMTNITMTLGGGATGATVAGLPTGVTSSVSGTTLTISGTPTTSGTFNYTVTTTGNACTPATTTGTITVNPVHTITAGSNQTICQNAAMTNITMTLGGGATGATIAGLPAGVTSSVSGTTLTISGTPTASGTFNYTVTTTGNACTPATTTGTITVNPVHTITAGSNQTVCENGAMTNITMTLGGGATGATVAGLPAGVTSSVSGTTLTISGTPTASGTFNYTVTTTGNACTPATTSGTITVNPPPVYTLTKTDPTSCGGTDGTIVISGLSNSTSYAVTYLDGGTTVGPTNYTSNASGTITITGLNSGTYSGFSLTNNSTGCIGTNSTILTLVDPGAPVLQINNPSAVCTPATVDLTAAAITAGSTGGGILSYWSDASCTIALGTPSSVSTGGTYYIQSNASGCTDVEQVIVTINATPSLTINNPAAVCSPNTVDLTAAAVTAGSTNVGTLSYWNDALATNSLTTPAAVSTSNTYYIQATNAGCTSIAPVSVTVNATPVLSINDPAAVCSPNTVDITAAAVTAGSTNTGTLSYWNDAAATSALASPAAISTSSTYYIQATNSGCTDIEPVIVTVNTTPVLSITDPAAVCSPATVDITAAAVTSGSTNLGTMTYWSDAAATMAVTTPSAIAVSGMYYIQSANGSCTDIQPVNVVVNQTPVLTITNPGAVCSPATVDITAAAVTAGSTNVGTLSYWNDAAATSSLANASAISTSNTYYIQAANGSCSDIASVIVVVNALPLAPTAGTDSTYCSSWTIEDMTANGGSGIFTWYTDAALNTVHGTGSSIAPQSGLGTVIYYVTETLNGCEGPASTVTITIQDCEIIVPTAITPNGDGIHDTWEIVDLDNVYPNNVVTVYNRWGNMIYQSEQGNYAGKPWDGTYEGKDLPVASYYFVIDFNDDKKESQTGIVSIVLEK